MTEFYRRYLELCRKVGKAPTVVATDIGLNKSTCTAWKRGSVPTAATLEKLDVYFGETVFLDPPPETKKAPTPEGERQSDFADEVTQFLLTLPKDRLRGILLALGAPEALLSELDQQE